MSNQAATVADGIMTYLRKENLTGLLPEILTELRKKAGAEKVQILVESAKPFNEKEQEEIEQILAQNWNLTGKINYQTEPKLIGGMKISIGDKVLDLSVKARLEKVYEQI